MTIRADGQVNAGNWPSVGCNVNPIGIISLRRDGAGTDPVFQVYNGGTNTANRKIELKQDGSITGVGIIRHGASTSSNYVELRTEGGGADKRGTILISKDDASSTQRGINFMANGSTTSYIKYNGSTTFNLEFDDPSKYVTTKNADGETEAVYNGKTLDELETLQSLLERAAKQDEAIADLTRQITELKGATK